MKLIVQIPCLNEEMTLPDVLKDIPRTIEGIDQIEVLVIDDGSTDGTVDVAQKWGVDHVLRHYNNRGLGKSFSAGLEFALNHGADILVNTDGDNQYPSKYISELVQPIIHNRADIVVGDRQTSQIKYFSPIKRLLQKFGTWFTVLLAGEQNITDAVSGFRAYSRRAMIELNVTTNFSYVLDTTIQAKQKNLGTVSIPIVTNPPTRPSRLFNSILEHVWKSGTGILRVFAFYKPTRTFFVFGTVFLILGLIPLVRFLYYYYFVSAGTGKIQSLIIGGILLSISFNIFALGVVGDLMNKNRSLIESTLKILKTEFMVDKNKDASKE